jgi:putative ABC transport system permease protein
VIVELSIRTLFRRRSRTVLAGAGIAVSAALLVDMTMLASGLTRSFGELTRAQGYALRVTPAGTLPFDSEAGIRNAAELRARLSAVEGVRAVAPVLGAQLYSLRHGEVREPHFTIGVDPSGQMLYHLLRGGEPVAGEVVVSRPLAEAYELEPGAMLAIAAELDVTLGRPRAIETFRISGIGDFIYDYAGQRSLALPLTDLQRLTRRKDEVSLFALAVSPDFAEAEVAARVAGVAVDLSVYSTAELMGAMHQRLRYFQQVATVLGAIALGVAALLVGTIVTIGVRERFGEIATLRAIGVPALRLQLGIVAEGVVLTAAACAAGLPLGWLLARQLDGILLGFPGIPARISFFFFEPAPVFGALGAVVLVGALAGILPGMRALRSPLAQALREEAD